METVRFNNHDYNVVAGQYPADPIALYVCLIDVNDNMDMSSAHRITVCLPDSTDIEYAGMTYLNSNIPYFDVVRAVTETGLAKPVVRNGEAVVRQSGFVDYPLYQFDMEKILRLADPEDISEYVRFWNSYYSMVSMDDHILVIPEPFD